MLLRAQRIYLEEATVSILTLPGLTRFWLLEDTLKGEGLLLDSCVPEGEYSLEWHSSSKYPATYALVGNHVGHFETDHHPPKPRNTVLFHGGNTTADTRGCPLVHSSPPVLVPVAALPYGSKAAFQRLISILKAKNESHRLLIQKG